MTHLGCTVEYALLSDSSSEITVVTVALVWARREGGREGGRKEQEGGLECLDAALGTAFQTRQPVATRGGRRGGRRGDDGGRGAAALAAPSGVGVGKSELRVSICRRSD